MTTLEQQQQIHSIVPKPQLHQLPTADEFNATSNNNKKRNRDEFEEQQTKNDGSKSKNSAGSKPKRRRMKYTTEQIQLLENIYLTDPLPNLAKREELAAVLKRSARSVQIWFQNKRAKDKKSKEMKRSESNSSLSGNEDQVEASTASPEAAPVETAIPSQQQLQLQQLQQNLKLPSLKILTSAVFSLLENTVKAATAQAPVSIPARVSPTPQSTISPSFVQQITSSPSSPQQTSVQASSITAYSRALPLFPQLVPKSASLPKSVFPIERLQIGTCRHRIEETEIRAFFDGELMEIGYEIQEPDQKLRKMTIDFLDILYMQSNSLNEKQATLSFYLLRPPRFFEEETPGSTMFKVTEDFTNNREASKINVHVLIFSRGIIDQIVKAIKAMHPRFAGCFIDDLYRRKLSPYYWFVPAHQRTMNSLEGIIPLVSSPSDNKKE